MAYHVRSYSSSASQQPYAQRITNQPVTSKTAQSSAKSMYHAHIAGFWRNVAVLWIKNLMNHSLSISIDGVELGHHYECKIDLKPWHFWAKKGYKTFEVDGNEIEAYWDLRSAKFSGSPEPCSDYYVALVSEEEVVLLLGDYKKKAYKRTKARPPLVDAMMISKKEHVFGKKSFSTRARFDHKNREHDIVVESSTSSGHRDPEMWISVDGIVLIHIKNLQWKFRGNQTVVVNKMPVQVFWDVHAWLFCAPGSSHGLFIFKPGAAEAESDAEENSWCDDGSDCSANSRYYSTRSYSKASQFCLFLYAWKIE